MPYVAPTTKSTGDLITAAIWNQDVVDNQNAAFPLGVAAWTSYTPTLTQNATVTKTVTYAKYQRVGRLITVQGFLSVTGAGTGVNAVVIGLPVAAAQTSGLALGVGVVFDSSATLAYKGIVMVTGASTVSMYGANDTVATAYIGAGGGGFSAALASGDTIAYTATYESAT